MHIFRPDATIEVDDFTGAYIECALWSSCHFAPEDWEPPEDYEGPEDGDPLDGHFSPEDIAPDTLKGMIKDCADFQEAEAADLEGLDPSQSGHDFWLTRNGHGAGFWDRGLGDVGDRLTDAAHAYGSHDLYVGDDNKIHGN